MQESNIYAGERLPDTTRMEFPERSFAEEMLDTPVPFKNRISFFASHIDPSEELTEVEIATRLGVRTSVVRKLANDIDAPFEVTDQKQRIYGEYTLELIQEEIAWNSTIASLPEAISITEAASYLGIHRKQVEKMAAELHIYPTPSIADNRRVFVYPKSTIRMLRTLQLHAPPAHDAYSITELQRLTGKDHRWIKKIAKTQGIETILRTNHVSREVVDHYPEEILPLLEEAKKVLPPPAGDWLTLQAIADIIGKSRNWVQPRLEEFSHLAEERLTFQSIPKCHYPPEIVTLLQEKFQIATEDESVWYSDAEIATLAMRSIFWTRARTKGYRESAKVMPARHANNKPAYHYPQHVMELVVKLSATDSK